MFDQHHSGHTHSCSNNRAQKGENAIFSKMIGKFLIQYAANEMSTRYGNNPFT